MNLSENQIKRVSTPLIGFSRNSIRVEDEITLSNTTETPPQQSMVYLTFKVVRVSSTYNIILELLGLNKLDAIIST